MERRLNRTWDLILPGCGGNATLAGLVTIAARWLHELQSISNLRVGFGFAHCTVQY